MRVQKKRYLLMLLYTAAAVPLVAWGAMQALQMRPNSPLDWVSEKFPARLDYEQFRDRFGSGDVVVVGWDGCTVDSPALARFVKILRQAQAFHTPDGAPYFERVISGQEVFRSLTSPPLSLDPDLARARLRGTFLGPDDQTTCAVVVFTPAGLESRERAVRLIKSALKKYCELPAEQLHLAGPIMDGLNVDISSAETLHRFGGPSAFVILILTWWSLRSLRAALLVFAISIFCQGAILALMHFCGDSLSALLIVMPPLIQVLAVSAGIHLTNYYYDAAATEGVERGGRHAFQLGWLPCTLSVGTTAVGLASLMVSELSPIRAFGAYGSVGTMLMLAMVLIFIPGTLAFWPRMISTRAVQSGESSSARIHEWLQPLRHCVLTRPNQVAFGSVLAMALLGAACPWLQTSVRIRTLMRADSRLLQDYAWLEEHVGPLVPIEVLLQFPADKQGGSSLERLELVQRIEGELAELSQVSGTMSAATFTPAIPENPDVPVATLRGMASRALEKNLDRLVSTNFLSRTSEGDCWRVIARVSALNDMDYGEFLLSVKRRLAPILQEAEEDDIHVTASYTGIMPLVHEIQRKLFTDLFNSFLSAFVVITLLMTVVQGGIIAGLVSMVSNLFPTVIVFGLLGWMQTPLDIGSVMSASIALGIAIDDTLHFLTFFKREINLGKSRREAVIEAYRACAGAMVQSSVVCGFGLFVFALADFVPTSRFAWMMLSLLMLALLGDLAVLPALLLGPFGAFFKAEGDVKSSDATLADSRQQPLLLQVPECGARESA
jgi:predicted RND superfamily exporter protein